MKTKPRAIRFSVIEETEIETYAQEHDLTFSDVVRQATQSFLAHADSECLSLSELASRSAEEDPDLLYGQFLDDFSHANDKDKLIDDEPQWKGPDASFWLCVLAATAHKLAHDNSLPVPKWALSERFVSPEPIYGMDTKNPEFQKYLEETTPLEFRWHNVFLGSNAMMRA